MKKSILASTPFLILNKSLLVTFGIDANVVLSHLYQQQNYFKEQKTWNTSLRYKRWCRNNARFDKGNKTTEPKFPDYYDIHFAKRLEQDQTALTSYYKHLQGLGYEKKVNSYDGKIKWIKR